MPIFLPHLPEKATWPLDLWMHLHSAPLHILFHLCFSLSKLQLILKLKWLFSHQWTSSLHLLSPVPLSHPAFTTSRVSAISHPFSLKDFSNKDAKKTFSRVFYHKFLLVSCLRMLLRRTWWPVLRQTWSKHSLQASHSWVHPQIRSCIPAASCRKHDVFPKWQS